MTNEEWRPSIPIAIGTHGDKVERLYDLTALAACLAACLTASGFKIYE